jgi:hypothetical protein
LTSNPRKSRLTALASAIGSQVWPIRCPAE